jgi:hypothetical protein
MYMHVCVIDIDRACVFIFEFVRSILCFCILLWLDVYIYMHTHTYTCIYIYTSTLLQDAANPNLTHELSITCEIHNFPSISAAMDVNVSTRLLSVPQGGKAYWGQVRVRMCVCGNR